MNRQSISVCIPARDEQSTIGTLVETLSADLSAQGGVVDEIIVLDHGSVDATSQVAHDAGATVVNADVIGSAWGPAQGKGDVLWRSLLVSRGDIVVWLDADLTSFPPDGVRRLVEPLIVDPGVVLVKGAFTRSLNGHVGEGGRVTELAAKPVLRLLAPELAWMRQPLSGQCAVRRDAVEHAVFEIDYGVEIGLLLDLVFEHGPQAVCEVDLGPLDHRHQSLAALGQQSEQVLRALLSRKGHRELDRHAVGRPPMASLRLGVA